MWQARKFEPEYSLADFLAGHDDDLPDFTSVHNDYLRLHSDLQGYGLANPMYAAQTDFAKSLGAHSISMRANLDVGGYAWPLLGYDFADDYDREYARDRVKNRLDWLSSRHNLLTDEEVQDYWDMVDDLEHAWDFARFEVSPDVGRDHPDMPEWRRVGKSVMLGSSYDAERYLSDRAACAVMDRTVRERLKKAGLYTE